ncbi:AfsR/SARP family transcriptional regulator [Micromonospora siamensis]|uniref:AfsR/SARP family transcriptional regulator n=1 Tax=Micromonospora siamensis TaxID=299152 RepID=UPI000B5AF4F2|nr:BTAD domain-containing putative transcriptional regulator [Micromonospora siamensis]
MRVLGPLEVLAADGRMLLLGTPKQRLVLGVLALSPDHLVQLDALVDELWPIDPPRSAVANVRTYAANLRRAFAAADPGRHLIVREADGYRLALPVDSIDLGLFSDEYRTVREHVAQGLLETAARSLSLALSRRRGPLLAGLPLGSMLSGRRVAVEEEMLAATELLADVRIQLGSPGEAASLLRPQVKAHPLREPSHFLLVRALYQQGDVVGALDAYRFSRDALREHLGIEPGPEFQRLHRAILNRAPVVGAAAPAGAFGGERPGLSASLKSWLPRGASDFVGRASNVARLLAETRRVEAQTAAVHVIDGMAGSGKTTLAVHVARRLADRYPDAQLFIDLCGHGEKAPVEPSAALVTLLRQLGVEAGLIPAEQDLRVQLWRRELAARRAVVVLDNAASSDQIAPLLPALPGTIVLVTSRRRLATPDGGLPESLAVMTPDEGLQLLKVTAGADRIDADPEAAAEAVRRCGYLPLAIRLAGSRLAHRRKWRVADLAARLAAPAPVLDQLGVEDRSVAGAFAASYEPLDESGKRMIRVLGVFPGHFTIEMAAALAELPLATAVRVVDDLVDRHLVEETGGDRYRLHDLMRHYANQLSPDDHRSDRHSAVGHLLNFVLHAVLAANEGLLDSHDVRAELAPDPAWRPDLLAAAGVLGPDWLERERATLAGLVEAAQDSGQYDFAWRLARATWRFYYIRGYFDDIRHTHRLGLAAAEALGDHRAVAAMSNYLASAHLRTGDYDEAARLIERSVALARELADDRLLLRYQANMSVVHWLRGELQESVALGTAMLRHPKFLGSVRGPHVLSNLGLALTVLGRYDDALHVHRLHLFLARVNGDLFHTTNALGHLAAVKVRSGQWASAVRILNAALMLRQRTGHRYSESENHNDLGIAYRNLGRLEDGVRQHELALELAIDSGERHAQAAALNDLAFTWVKLGQTADATRAHRRALESSTRIAHPYEQGRALAGIAELVAVADPAEARRYWQRALAIFERMGVPERSEVRRRLDGLRDQA